MRFQQSSIINMGFNAIGREAVDRMYLVIDRAKWGDFFEHGHEPSTSIKCWVFLD